jgi:flavin reductase (DIM6/NTAB) family NADH-FMN oxidoreductase RutF
MEVIQQSERLVDFAKAMRRLASTVCVVATQENRQPCGMVATAVTSLSVAPPSLLVCINKDASSHAVIERVGSFSVTLLRRDQREISDQFGSRYSHPERFASTRWKTSSLWQLPYLDGAQATFFCSLAGQFEHGTHTVFVGEVRQTMIDESVDPLLYANGSYRWLDSVGA